jgi:histidine decarboxylase
VSLSLAGDGPHPHADVTSELGRLLSSFEETSAHLLGFQANQDVDYSALAGFLRFSPNNIGDPYVDSNYGVGSREMERAVLDYFARLLHADDQAWWGYVTSGGTEANLYGIYLGRNRLEAVAAGGGAQPIAYYSEDSHYSIGKAMDILRVPSTRVASDEQGRIRVDRLLDAVLRADPDTHPPLIVANIGTTFTGAYDDVEAIVEALDAAGVRHYHLHVDGALGGFVLPFLERSGRQGGRVPRFDFGLPISSVAVSGHKVIGAPFPCGVFLTRQENLAYGNSRLVEYVGSIDTTLAGSRSGLAPIVLWYAIATHGTSGFSDLCQRMLETAEYAQQRLDDAGWRPRRADLSLSVIFDRPPDWVVRKWSLSTQGEQAHVYAMAHMTRERIDGLLDDLDTVRRVLDLTTLSDDVKVLDVPQALREIDLLAGLDPEDLWRVGRVARERRVAAGEYLCRQGDEGDEMFIVVDGEIEVIDDANGSVTFVATRGMAVGEIAVLTDLPRVASLRCRTEVHLLVIEGRDFRTLMHELPVISTRIVETLVRRLVTAGIGTR